MIWKSAADCRPPDVDPTEFGWHRDENQLTLRPATVLPNVAVAPDYVLQMIRCGCAAIDYDKKCSTMRCCCANASISCTVSCGCQGDSFGCGNKFTLSGFSDTDDGSDEEDLLT